MVHQIVRFYKIACQLIRRKPVEELLTLGETYTILDVFPYNINVRKLFAPILVDAKSYKDVAQAYQSIAYFISASNAHYPRHIVRLEIYRRISASIFPPVEDHC
jgi:hypothetical protein